VTTRSPESQFPLSIISIALRKTNSSSRRSLSHCPCGQTAESAEVLILSNQQRSHLQEKVKVCGITLWVHISQGIAQFDTLSLHYILLPISNNIFLLKNVGIPSLAWLPFPRVKGSGHPSIQNLCDGM